MAMAMCTTQAAAMTTASGSTPSTARALISLMWLASPALPVGGFSYSEGLEAAVNAGLVHDEATTAHWLTEQFHLVLARGEWPVLARAMKAWEMDDFPALQACNDWILQTRESREFRLQTEQMGRSLARWIEELTAQPQDPSGRPAGAHRPQRQMLERLPGGPTWPVAFALACSHAGATPEQALLAMAFSWAENQTQAAIKCVPLGQAAGQRVLATLAHEMEVSVEMALQSANKATWPPRAFAPGLAILSAQHEEQYSRLFRS